MNGTLWDSINLALSAALLVVALAALHTSKNWTQHKQRNATAILKESHEKNSFTPPSIVSKQNGFETQQPPATYAAYRSYQVTPLKQIMLKQETQTANSKQLTENVMQAGVAAHSPSQPTPDN